MARKSAVDVENEGVDIRVGNPVVDSVVEGKSDPSGDKPVKAAKVLLPLEEIRVLNTRKVLFGNKVLDLKAGQTLKVTSEFKKVLIVSGDAIAV